MENHIIGVDIGGTNIRVALLNERLELIKKETASTTDYTAAKDLYAQIKKMIKKVDSESKVNRIGIVLPAPWTKDKKTITDATNVPYLENVKIEEMKAAFCEYQIYLENDVNVIALLESDFGAAKNSKHSVYITVSTGIGSGVIIHNRIYHGANGYAGEIGSIIVSDKEATRDNPLQGSLEEMCSGKALELKSIALYGDGATARQLFVNYEKGEKGAKQLVDEWFADLSRGLAAVIQMMDPDVIVLGGPVILNHEWILEKLKNEIAAKVLGHLAGKTKIAAAEFGIEAGVIGAGYYALAESGGDKS